MEEICKGREIKANHRYQVSAPQILSSNLLSPIWKQFVEAHTSRAFYLQMLQIFGGIIRETYPWLENFYGKKLEDLSCGIRGISSDAEIVLDCQPGINSPSTKSSRVRGPHVDNPRELFAALLYLRDEKDDSVGGALEVYKVRNPKFLFYSKAEIKDRDVELVASVPYAANTMVFFINTIHSIHAVSERHATPHCRRLVNIIGELPTLPKGLFEIQRDNSFKTRAMQYLHRKLSPNSAVDY